MIRNLLQFAPVGVYVFGILATILIVRKMRPTRWPFKLEHRLLRGPGESLQRERNRLLEQLMFEFFGGIFAVLGLCGLAFIMAAVLHLGWNEGIFAISLVCGGVTLISALRIVALWKKLQAYHLGWFGERIVAEKLGPLRFTGWRVFHDVPFTSNGKEFNLDHVVLGEGGLFVIETKARRKGGGRKGAPDDVVTFDGQALHWPRYKNDESGLRQAELNAETLSKWLKEEIGEKVAAIPLLVIPGWTVKFTKSDQRRLCRVESANWIQKKFKDLPAILAPKTVDLVYRRLLVKCRDVEE